MSRHACPQHQRTFVVSLVVLVALCFLCALCHNTQTAPRFTAAPTATDQCAEQSGETAVEAAPSHQAQNRSCEASEGQGLLTGQPLFLAFGAALVLCLVLAPRPGPVLRLVRYRTPVPYGFGLLTLLCVQRV